MSYHIFPIFSHLCILSIPYHNQIISSICIYTQIIHISSIPYLTTVRIHIYTACNNLYHIYLFANPRSFDLRSHSIFPYSNVGWVMYVDPCSGPIHSRRSLGDLPLHPNRGSVPPNRHDSWDIGLSRWPRIIVFFRRGLSCSYSLRRFVIEAVFTPRVRRRGKLPIPVMLCSGPRRPPRSFFWRF